MRTRRPPFICLSGHLRRWLALTLALVVPGAAQAGGTRTFRVTDFDDFDMGEAEGAAIEASGKVTPGLLPARADVPGASVFTCLGDGKDGKRAYVGTADAATIQRVSLGGKPGKDGKAAAPKVEPVATLKGAVVSALAQLPGGDLLAATLPGGIIYRVDAKGKVSTFAEFKVEQIWAIVPHQGRLLIATGPKGELFSINSEGKDTKVLLDSDEKDILSVLTIGKDIIVGTSPGAKLLQVGDPVEGVLLQDFTGDEVRALALTDTGLVAAVNDFSDRGLSSLQALTKNLGRTSLVGQPIEGSLDAAPSAPQSSADLMFVPLIAGKAPDLARAGELSWESWLHRDKQYFTSLLPGPGKGEVLVASSQAGKVYRVRGRRDVAVIADLEERQTTALCAFKAGGVLATAGDGAAVYALTAGGTTASSAAKARYRSKVFDAKQPAAYGAVYLRGGGPLTLRARSGPGEEVDRRWSDWKTVTLTRSADALRGALAVPSRRYVQLEVGLEAQAELRDISLFYAPENLAPLVQSVSVARPEFERTDDAEPDSKLTIKWKAEARDEDDLVYEVRIRPEGSGAAEWIRLGDEAPTTKKELKWDLASVPDGVYEAQILASDEPSNGSARARTDEVISAPFIVDHRRPVIDEAKVQGTRISARARDEGSHIHDVGYAIDGGPFRAASPADGLFDADNEAFEIVLPADLKPGKHRVVLRARDAFGNLGTLAVIVSR
ncbi:MAG: hypothetical protein H0T76_13775 [Nannocystis sp.]|nr:hypothetical protein [Nannocystis sp.]MBA3547548.1 hypothetical protein [Nannocystis sp.]